MDAQDNDSDNPFENPLRSLEWIASAMDAARRYKELTTELPRASETMRDRATASAKEAG